MPMSTTPIRNGAIAGVAVSVALLGMVKGFEGERLKTYKDPVGIPTNCIGHTGPDVKLGQLKTSAQCDVLLIADLRKAQNAVERHTREPISRGELDAYTDFTFNTGEAAYSNSTLLRKLNAGDHAGACAELPKWDKARTPNGTVITLPGLTTRRHSEYMMCIAQLKQTYHTDTKTRTWTPSHTVTITSAKP